MTLGVPSVDFGLIRLGDRAQTSLVLTNITQLEASWTLKERQDHKDTQVLSRRRLKNLAYVCAILHYEESLLLRS